MPRWILFAVLVAGAVVFLMFRARTLSTRSQQAHQAVEQGALLLDVRTPEEFASGHIQGAVNIPVDQLAQRAKELPSGKAGIVIYCRSGNRSRRAEHILRDKGFDNLIDLGPMSAW